MISCGLQGAAILPLTWVDFSKMYPLSYRGNRRKAKLTDHQLLTLVLRPQRSISMAFNRLKDGRVQIMALEQLIKISAVTLRQAGSLSHITISDLKQAC